MAKTTQPKRTVTLYSPKGTKVTVAADDEKTYTARRYSKTAPKPAEGNDGDK